MEVNCNNCGKDVVRTASEYRKSKSKIFYCSRSCAVSMNNLGVNRHYTDKNACKVCGKPTRTPDRPFCSRVCYRKNLVLNREDMVKKGGATAKVVRRYLMEKNNACVECGITDTYNGKPITLEMDHIDGDITNNTLDNCRLLCPNCHSQTDTYRAKNINNPRGIYARRSRYEKSIT